MEVIGLLYDGIVHATAPGMLAATALGAIIGLLIGALPGLGPSAGVAIMLPVAVGFGGTAAIACLAGVYYGSMRSEEHTSELQSLMRISYAVFCLKKKQKRNRI